MNSGFTKCRWQNGNPKSALGVENHMCTHLGCHEGEDFPCKSLLVGSMTWTWSSWDRHRVYRWNCGVGDGSPCPPETQTHHHSTRIWSPMKAVTFSCHLESLRLHSDSGAWCDCSNLQTVPGPDGESQRTALRLRAILYTKCRNEAQANAYQCWISGIHVRSSLPTSSCAWPNKYGQSELKMDNNPNHMNWTYWKSHSEMNRHTPSKTTCRVQHNAHKVTAKKLMR